MAPIRTARRREQSRSAAKSRRMTETEVYTELATALPGVGQQTVYQADRIGLLRLATMIYRTRRVMNGLYPDDDQTESDDQAYFDEATVSKCLDGFVIVVNKNGQLLYVSAGVSPAVGFTQIDLTGKYLRDYIHADDRHSLYQRLGLSQGDTSTAQDQNKEEPTGDCNVFFRMKTAMTPRGGRARKLTMAVYQPIQASVIDPSDELKMPSDSKRIAGDDVIRILYCTPFLLSPLQKPLSTTTASTANVANTRHEVNMRFRFCSDKLATALEYGSGKQLVNQSFYDFVFPQDLTRLVKELRQAYKRNHVTTSYYRLMTKSGGCIWVMTEAALLVQNIRGVTQKSMLCSHHVLTGPQSSGSEDLPLQLKTAAQPSQKVDLVQNKQSPVPATVIKAPDGMKNNTAGPSMFSPLSFTNAELNLRQRRLIQLVEEHALLYPTPLNNMDLFCLPTTSAPKCLEINSLLAAALTPTISFPNPIHNAVNRLLRPPIFNFDRSNLGSSTINTPTDISRLFVNSNSQPVASFAGAEFSQYAAHFLPCPPPAPQPIIGANGRFESVLDNQLRRQNNLDERMEIFADQIREGLQKEEIGRRHRLDAKTIEAFELAMIKNELIVENQ